MEEAEQVNTVPGGLGHEPEISAHARDHLFTAWVGESKVEEHKRCFHDTALIGKISHQPGSEKQF